MRTVAGPSRRGTVPGSEGRAWGKGRGVGQGMRAGQVGALAGLVAASSNRLAGLQQSHLMLSRVAEEAGAGEMKEEKRQ